MDRSSSRSLSHKGNAGKAEPAADEAASPKLQRGPSTLQLLTAAARAYLDSSVHGSRRGAAASAAPAPAGSGSSGGGSSGARQVADDSSASRRGQQQGLAGFQAQLAAIADGSGDSSSGGAGGSSHSSGGLVEAEGRRRGSSAAALAVGAAPRSSCAQSGLSPTASGAAPSLAAGLACPLGSHGVPPLPAGVPAGAAGGSAPVTRASSRLDPTPRTSFQADVPSSSSPRARSMFLEGSPGMEGIRAPVVVRRRSVDNPLFPPAGEKGGRAGCGREGSCGRPGMLTNAAWQRQGLAERRPGLHGAGMKQAAHPPAGCWREEAGRSGGLCSTAALAALPEIFLCPVPAHRRVLFC